MLCCAVYVTNTILNLIFHQLINVKVYQLIYSMDLK